MKSTVKTSTSIYFRIQKEHLKVDVVCVAGDQSGERLRVGALDVEQVVKDVKDQDLRLPGQSKNL